VPFGLWPDQQRLARDAEQNRLLIWLKARQLGLTWLALALALRELVFRPGVTVLLFSLRDEEAMELLERLKGMHRRLAPHLQAEATDNFARTKRQSAHEWVLPNGSRAKAFPANRGDSYTAAMAVVDEADLVEDLDALLGSVKPTIDAGGRLLLLSRSNKKKPNSAFKRIYRAAKAETNGYGHAFLPWSARPDRTAEWYAAQKAEILARTGSLDGLHEQYPATDTEALAPRSLDKRIAAAWLEKCYREQSPAPGPAYVVAGPGGKPVGTMAPAIPGLVVYAAPQPGHSYVVGADPAEGNPTSDDSAACVLDAATGEEVAGLAGKIEPTTLGAYAAAMADWYNRAGVMCERNNHGHAVIAELARRGVLVLQGHDGRPGWLSSQLGKTKLYDAAADAFRDGQTVLHSFAAYCQLASIEGNTLRAPEGEFDDLADAYALALAALSSPRGGLDLRIV
jgi:hypothetical protein